MKPQDLFEVLPDIGDVHWNFQLVSDIAVEKSDKDLFSSAFVSSLNSMSSKVQHTVEQVKLNPRRSDEALTAIADATNKELDGLLHKQVDPINKSIESETKSLMKISETGRSKEIRDNFSEFLGDPLKLAVSDMDDEVFHALASAPARPITFDKGNDKERVELKTFFTPEVVEKELRRRRPDSAARLDRFALRKDSAMFLANTLRKLVETATNTGTGWTPPTLV